MGEKVHHRIQSILASLSFYAIMRRKIKNKCISKQNSKFYNMTENSDIFKDMPQCKYGDVFGGKNGPIVGQYFS